MKSDPETYGWDELVRDGKIEWTGVRNFEARNNMKKMKKDDQVLFYHSGEDCAVIAIAKVVVEAHPDSTDKTNNWQCVDIAPVKKLKKSVSLKEIKTMPACKNMSLVRKSRLSVSPVTETEWKAILAAA